MIEKQNLERMALIVSTIALIVSVIQSWGAVESFAMQLNWIIGSISMATLISNLMLLIPVMIFDQLEKLKSQLKNNWMSDTLDKAMIIGAFSAIILFGGTLIWSVIWAVRMPPLTTDPFLWCTMIWSIASIDWLLGNLTGITQDWAFHSIVRLFGWIGIAFLGWVLTRWVRRS